MRRRGEDIPRAGAVKQPKYDSIEYLICSSDEENLQEVQTEDEPIIYNFVDVNNYADPNIQILTETATLQKPISKTVIPKQLTKTGPNTANIPKTSVNSNKTPQTPLSASLNKISVNTAASNSKMPPLVLRTPISNLVQSGFAKVTQNVTTTPTYRFTLANNSKSQEAIKNLSSKATGNKDNTPTYCAITEKLSQIESTLDAFIVNVNRRFHYLNILMNKIVQQNDRILSNHLTSTSIKENIELSEDEKLVEKITVKAVTKLQGNFTEVACIYEVGVDIPQELEELNMELIDTERQIHYVRTNPFFSFINVIFFSFISALFFKEASQ